jgi:hypothetical protein
MADQFRPHVDPPRPDFDALDDTDLEIPTISVPEGAAPVTPPQPQTGGPTGELDAAAQLLDPTASWTDTGDMPAPPPPPPPGESVIDDLQKPIVGAFSGEDVTARAPASATTTTAPVPLFTVGEHLGEYDGDIIAEPPVASDPPGEPAPGTPSETPPAPPAPEPPRTFWDPAGLERLPPMTGDRETSTPPALFESPFDRYPRPQDGLDRIGRGDEGGAEGSDSGLEIPTISVPGAIPRDESDPFDTGASPAPPAVRIPRPTDLIGLIGAFSPPMAAALVAMLILAGAGWALTRPADVAPVATPNANTPAGSAAPAPAAAAAQTATPTARRTTAAGYRVTGLPAKYSGACGDLTVTWAWTIDGLGDSGNYTIRYQRRDGASYLAETGPFTLRPGTTGAQTWDPATGRLELIEKGTQILRAEITQVLNRPVTGDAVSAAPPPPC